MTGIAAGSKTICGVVVSHMRTAGTEAQTRTVRIISQTAVIFSTITGSGFSRVYIS